MKRTDHDTKHTDAAYVSYAGELTETVRRNIETGVRREFPDVQDIIFENDEALVAGFRVNFRDMVIDVSVQEVIRSENRQ